MTTLYGELSHALRKTRDAEAYRRAIEEAHDAARRLKFMTEDLLALARLGADVRDPPEPVEPFYRGVYARAEDMPGAGLGVPMARQIARSHGGDLALDTEQTKGSRFVVRLRSGVVG